MKNIRTEKRMRLKRKIRSKISGTALIPRLSVFKSNVYIYAQLIDDANQITLVEASDIKNAKGTKTERAQFVGKEVAEKAKKKGISRVVFDRNGYKYTGRLLALANACRASGLQF